MKFIQQIYLPRIEYRYCYDFGLSQEKVRVAAQTLAPIAAAVKRVRQRVVVVPAAIVLALLVLFLLWMS